MQAEAAEGMVGGLKTSTVAKIKAVFARYPEIEQAILFGSRAKGSHRRASDIDLAIVGPQMSLKRLWALENELDDLLLPYEIDLCLMHKIDNEALLGHIKRVGVVFCDMRQVGGCSA